MEESSELPVPEDDRDDTDDGNEKGERADILASCSLTDMDESSQLPVERPHAHHEDDRDDTDDDGNEKDERTDILASCSLTDMEEAIAHHEGDRDDTGDDGNEKDERTDILASCSLTDMEESSQLPVERLHARHEDNRDDTDDDGNENDERTDILASCSLTDMEESRQLPVKRSPAHHEDDRDDTDGNEKDERIDRDHRKGGEDQQDRDGCRHTERQGSNSEVSGYGTSDASYRILCPIFKAGAVIGHGGSVIKSLRRDTKAKIKVEDVILGADEIVIHLSWASRRDRDGRSYDRDGHRVHDKHEMLCPAQDALFRIYHCITEHKDHVPASDEKDDENGLSPQVKIRLLVPESQVGCLMGRGGCIIAQMRKDTGAQILVRKANLPPCASPGDEFVQLSGTPALVKKALYAVSSKLYERSHRSSGVSQGAGGGMYHLAFHAPGSMMGMGHHGLLGFGNSGILYSSRMDGSPGFEFKVRVLCPNDKIGRIIGKGGSAIRKLQEGSGAQIKACDKVEDSDEQIIQISAIEPCLQYMDNYSSPVLKGVLRVCWRLAELSARRDGKTFIPSIRLLVSAHQIGCLIGKGGKIITKIRTSSWANICIHPKNKLPRCADEGSELVQVRFRTSYMRLAALPFLASCSVSGEAPMVEAALIEMLTRLRSNVFGGQGLGHGSHYQLGVGHGGREYPVSSEGYSHGYGAYSTFPGQTHGSNDSQRWQR